MENQAQPSSNNPETGPTPDINEKNDFLTAAPQPAELFSGCGFKDYTQDHKQYFYEMILLD